MRTAKITPPMIRILNFTLRFRKKFSFSPSYGEMQNELKMSTSHIFYCLNRLDEKGYIRRRKYTARSVIVTKQGEAFLLANKKAN